MEKSYIGPREVTDNFSQESSQDHAIDNKEETVKKEKYLPSQDGYEPHMWHGYEKANTIAGCTSSRGR